MDNLVDRGRDDTDSRKTYMSEQCNYHTQLVADIAVMKADIAYIRQSVCNHVEEGDKAGGWRDRLLVLEEEVRAFKKIAWTRLIVAGLIGGLIADGTPEVMKFIVGLFK